MPIFQVLFVCRPAPGLSEEDLTTAFEMMQTDCHDRKIGGFFLSGREEYIGLFEAEEKVVIDKIEQIVQAKKFRHVEVIRETELQRGNCGHWYVSKTEPVGIAATDFLSPEYLAEFICSTLKPLSRRLRQ